MKSTLQNIVLYFLFIFSTLLFPVVVYACGGVGGYESVLLLLGVSLGIFWISFLIVRKLWHVKVFRFIAIFQTLLFITMILSVFSRLPKLWAYLIPFSAIIAIGSILVGIGFTVRDIWGSFKTRDKNVPSRQSILLSSHTHNSFLLGVMLLPSILLFGVLGYMSSSLCTTNEIVTAPVPVFDTPSQFEKLP